MLTRNVTLSILASNALSKDRDALARFMAVGRALHCNLRSGRTSMTWGLGLKKSFKIDEEYARLCDGEKSSFRFEPLDLSYGESSRGGFSGSQ